MNEKLDSIQEIVATLLSRVDEFRGLSLAIAPDAQLSDQAISILRQFVDSGDETLLYHSFGGGQFALQTDRSEPFGITDPRFLQSDFEQLVGTGLLTFERNADDAFIFRLTRNAIRYLKTLDGASQPERAES
jgi:hypothetical protein